jgi:ParB family transcriptional regulator, chromosome partitioning protein
VSKKRAGLGRGLAALLGEPPVGGSDGGGGEALPDGPQPGEEVLDIRPAEPSAAPSDGAGWADAGAGDRPADLTGPAIPTVVDLPVGAIRPNPRQPRRHFDPEALEELARSIGSTGVVQPIIVRPLEGGRYEIIAGERRWRASQMAGYTVVPAILRHASDVESLEISLIENVVRQQLNPVDEAFALHVLLDDLGVTQETLAARIGKSRSAVANKLRLLELPRELQEFLTTGLLSEGHGRALLGLKGRGEQLRVARRAVSQGLSVRAVEGEVKRRAEKKDPAATTTIKVALSDELAEEARDSFWQALEVVPRIKIGPEGEAGRVELPFRDLDELRNMIARLTGSSI